ncbi:serine hydrolase [Steroidobacter sp.]|uniref:serine hydrolase n=1 Tax=Steroidobacter sp. TaxID=1978227 RepID=UPI001A47A27E|nr:serine hydrolase [Steroidobacter sp.]MBL8268648.1 serine hydrolase [Steroidobacter sp.]
MSRGRHYIWLAAWFIVATTSSVTSSASAAELGPSIDAVFAKWDTTTTPGCSVAAAKDGVTAHARGYGLANIEHDVPNRADTVIHIASVSKQFTAAAIGMLALERRLSLSDSVRKYVPELPAVTQPITIAHLVHHTSGLKDFSDLMDVAGWRYYQDLVTTEDAMSVLVKHRSLWFEPGSRYQYNNSNYLLLGVIVKRITGSSLRDFARERIFEPLGMRDTQFRDHFAQIVPRSASGYSPTADGFETSLTNFSTDGYSSVLTTVQDLMKWEENWYSAKVGGRALFDLMLTRAPLNDGSPNKYAFGVVVDSYRGLQIVEHSGGDAGYASHLLRFPERHVSVAVLCNANNAGAHELALRTAEVVLGLQAEAAKPKPAPAAKPAMSSRALTAAELQRYVGTYRSDEIDAPFRVDVVDGRLELRSIKFKAALSQSADNTFKAGWHEVAFDITKGGAVTGFRLGSAQYPLAHFTLVNTVH